jgi:endoplasmic reticulum junction formation protein lunapark
MPLWPFSRPTQTPASYERHLSKLTTRIHSSSSSLASRRAQARRFRALWTLYSSIAYLVYLIVALLVIGWREWGAYEVSAVAGGPVAIYGIRKGVDTLMGWRVVREEEKLQSLKRERETVIRELKEATGYERTQGLLDKYGGEKKRRGGGAGGEADDDDESGPSKTKQRGSGSGKRSQQHQQHPRTGFAPPPTANIPSRQSLPAGFRPTPQGVPSPPPPKPGSQQHAQVIEPSASFAPNAFPGGSPPHSPPQSPSTHSLPPASPVPEPPSNRWYDRLLDVLLGDDESAPRNRLALLCNSCGLVNGLAPPGARSLADIGKWRCSGCGALNNAAMEKMAGTKAEEKRTQERAVAEAMPEARKIKKMEKEGGEEGEDSGSGSDRTVYSDEDEDEDDGAEVEVEVEEKKKRHKGTGSEEKEKDQDEDEEVSSPAKGTRSRRGRVGKGQ